MTIKNQYNLELDIKRLYTGIVPSFTKSKVNEITIKVLDNGEYFDISSVEKVTVAYKDAYGRVLQKTCDFINLNDHKVVLINVSKLDIAIGNSDLTVTLEDSFGRATLQSFKVDVIDGFNNN